MQGEHLKIYRLDLMQSKDNCKHFQRDYGAILMNRVGRKGYKIHIQVVGLLWDFRFLKHFFLQIWFCTKFFKTVRNVFLSCSTTSPAEYIPTWPSLPWISELIDKKDSACVKLVRSKITCGDLKTMYFRVCLDEAREHSWILRKQRGLKVWWGKK